MNIELFDSLSGKVVFVTGSNRGIGEAIASKLVELDATVYAGARKPEDISQPEQIPVQIDITNQKEIISAVDRIEEERERLDILINNAAIYGPAEPLHKSTTEEIDRTLNTNLRGPLLLIKKALPLLLKNKGSHVINLSSRRGQFRGNFVEGMKGDHGPYAISKAGLNALTLYLHSAHNSDGLLANAVSPGRVNTEFIQGTAKRTPEQGAETPVWLARFKPNSPSGHFWKDKSPIDW